MKIKLEILLGGKTDMLLTFEFTDWLDFKDFLKDWLRYCQVKQVKAKIHIQEDAEQK